MVLKDSCTVGLGRDGWIWIRYYIAKARCSSVWQGILSSSSNEALSFEALEARFCELLEEPFCP